jgi:amino acid permease|mmetsp:Transcript_28323/g.37815  ORF Transcript_28323/g.37815 Transcript_28323/m.37815 type:complete len:195 (+) Transcript_28323:676-1260(+)
MVVHDNVKLWYFLPALMLIYVPLVWIRDMEKLAWSHLLGNILILTVVTAVIVYSGLEIGDTGKVYKNDFITKDAIKAVPYSAFAFEGVAVVMPLREIVADQKNFMKLTSIVVTCICAMYIFFSEFSDLAYGSQENYTLILDALPSTGVITYCLKGLYTVNLFFSYPMMMTPAIDLVEGFIFNENEAQTPKRYWL